MGEAEYAFPVAALILVRERSSSYSAVTAPTLSNLSETLGLAAVLDTVTIGLACRAVGLKLKLLDGVLTTEGSFEYQATGTQNRRSQNPVKLGFWLP